MCVYVRDLSSGDCTYTRRIPAAVEFLYAYYTRILVLELIYTRITCITSRTRTAAGSSRNSTVKHLVVSTTVLGRNSFEEYRNRDSSGKKDDMITTDATSTTAGSHLSAYLLAPSGGDRAKRELRPHPPPSRKTRKFPVDPCCVRTSPLAQGITQVREQNVLR